MEPQTNLLIVSREFSLYSAVQKTSLAGDFSLFFCRPDENCLSIVRENAVRIVLVDSAEARQESESLLKKLKHFDSLIDVVIMGRGLDSEAILGWIHMGATDYVAMPFQPATVSEGPAEGDVPAGEEARKEIHLPGHGQPQPFHARGLRAHREHR